MSRSKQHFEYSPNKIFSYIASIFGKIKEIEKPNRCVVHSPHGRCCGDTDEHICCEYHSAYNDKRCDDGYGNGKQSAESEEITDTTLLACYERTENTILGSLWIGGDTITEKLDAIMEGYGPYESEMMGLQIKHFASKFKSLIERSPPGLYKSILVDYFEKRKSQTPEGF